MNPDIAWQDYSKTERWLIDWLNWNASVVQCNEPKTIPVLAAFMVGSLAKAIDEYKESK
jgi:hypothetical protein